MEKSHSFFPDYLKPHVSKPQNVPVPPPSPIFRSEPWVPHGDPHLPPLSEIQAANDPQDTQFESLKRTLDVAIEELDPAMSEKDIRRLRDWLIVRRNLVERGS